MKGKSNSELQRMLQKAHVQFADPNTFLRLLERREAPATVKMERELAELRCVQSHSPPTRIITPQGVSEFCD